MKLVIRVLICWVFFLIALAGYADETLDSVMEKDNGSSAPTIITCDGPLDVDFDKNIAVFHENVVIKDEEGELYADIMRVFFEGDDREISRVEAQGKVLIYIDNKIAKSEKAVYDVVAGKLELTGNPRIQEDKNIYAADKITIFNKDGKTEMKLEPKARLLLYRDDMGDDGLFF